jgi:parallel beta-helix repeat protein
MKIAVTILIGLAGFGLQIQQVAAQGSLTPPGPPAAGMLTLSQVEPRTPVDATHTPGNNFAQYVISNSGSYYLTTNIFVSSGGFSAIYIVTNDVTLDLNGFSLLGASGAAYGINVESSCTNITVHDGLINGWSDDGVYCAGSDATLDRVTVSGDNVGIVLTGPGRCVVRNSIVSRNTGDGIYCSENNVTLDHLLVSSNNPGVYFTGVASGVIEDCTVNENVGEAVDCVSSTNITLQDLTISHNNGYGLVLQSCQYSTVSDCKINGNGNNEGIYLLGSSCLILGNSSSGNGIGFYVQGANNQIDGNHVIGNSPSGFGIWIDNAAGVTNNIVIRNVVTGYGANDYSLGTAQIAGPIINSVASQIVTNSNPWANFGF